MSEKEPLEPYELPLSVDLPGVFAMSKGNPSDAAIDRWRFWGERTLSPEEELCAALLVSTIEDFTAVEIKEGHYKTANAWLFGSADYELSFDDVCSYLRLDPSYIRRRVAAMAPTERRFKVKKIPQRKQVNGDVRDKIIEALQTDMIGPQIRAFARCDSGAVRRTAIEVFGAEWYAARRFRLRSLAQAKRQRREA